MKISSYKHNVTSLCLIGLAPVYLKKLSSHQLCTPQFCSQAVESRSTPTWCHTLHAWHWNRMQRSCWFCRSHIACLQHCLQDATSAHTKQQASITSIKPSWLFKCTFLNVDTTCIICVWFHLAMFSKLQFCQKPWQTSLLDHGKKIHAMASGYLFVGTLVRKTHSLFLVFGNTCTVCVTSYSESFPFNFLYPYVCY